MFEGGILKAGVPEELVEDEMVRLALLRTNFEERRNWSFKYTPYKDREGLDVKKHIKNKIVGGSRPLTLSKVQRYWTVE
jgi:hypothetical protein